MLHRALKTITPFRNPLPDFVYQKLRERKSDLDKLRLSSSYTNLRDAEHLSPLSNKASREEARKSLCRRQVGNCDEKAFFCLSFLEKLYHVHNHSGVPNAYAAMFDTIGAYGHVFVCIVDSLAAFKPAMRLRDLGVNAVILDGWVQDFHFPNNHHFSKLHDPSQIKVISSIKSANILYYNYPEDGPIPLFIP